jgi:hypothetical protein
MPQVQESLLEQEAGPPAATETVAWQGEDGPASE